MKFEGLTEAELKYIRCIVCNDVLIAGKEIVRIVEYVDKNCSEEFQFYFAHLNCLMKAVNDYRKSKRSSGGGKK